MDVVEQCIDLMKDLGLENSNGDVYVRETLRPDSFNELLGALDQAALLWSSGHPQFTNRHWSSLIVALLQYIVGGPWYNLMSVEERARLVDGVFQSELAPGLASLSAMVAFIRRPDRRHGGSSSNVGHVGANGGQNGGGGFTSAVKYVADQVCSQPSVVGRLFRSALVELRDQQADHRAVDDFVRAVLTLPSLLAGALRGQMAEACFPGPFAATLAATAADAVASDTQLLDVCGRVLNRLVVLGHTEQVIDHWLWPCLLEPEPLPLLVPQLLACVASPSTAGHLLCRLMSKMSGTLLPVSVDANSCNEPDPQYTDLCPLELLARLLRPPVLCCPAERLCDCGGDSGDDRSVNFRCTGGAYASILAEQVLINDDSLAVVWDGGDSLCLPMLRLLVHRLVHARLPSPFNLHSLILTVASHWAQPGTVRGGTDQQHEWIGKALYYLLCELGHAQTNNANQQQQFSVFFDRLMVIVTGAMRHYLNSPLLNRRALAMKIAETVSSILGGHNPELPQLKFDDSCLPASTPALTQMYDGHQEALDELAKHRQRLVAARDRKRLQATKRDDGNSSFSSYSTSSTVLQPLAADLSPTKAEVTSAELSKPNKRSILIEEIDNTSSSFSTTTSTSISTTRTTSSATTISVWGKEFEKLDMEHSDELPLLSADNNISSGVSGGDLLAFDDGDDDESEDEDEDDEHEQRFEEENEAQGSFGVAGVAVLQEKRGKQRLVDLRDCLETFSDQTKRPQRLRNLLRRIAVLARRGSVETDEETEDLAVSLVRRLLATADPFELKDFFALRHDALVATTCLAPVAVAPVLTTVFYEPNHDLQQRSAVLDCISEAAVELAGGGAHAVQQLEQEIQTLSVATLEPSKRPFLLNQDNSSSPAPSLLSPPDANQSTTGPVVRRWGYLSDRQMALKKSKNARSGGGQQRRAVDPLSNRLAAIGSGHFIWPLLRRWDDPGLRFDLFGEDVHLLGQLLATLATVLAAAGPNRARAHDEAQAVLDFCLVCLEHEDPFVRRAAAFGVAQCAPMVRNIGQNESVGRKMVNVAQQDPDVQTRMLAMSAIQLVVQKSKN